MRKDWKSKNFDYRENPLLEESSEEEEEEEEYIEEDEEAYEID